MHLDSGPSISPATTRGHNVIFTPILSGPDKFNMKFRIQHFLTVRDHSVFGGGDITRLNLDLFSVVEIVINVTAYSAI